MDTMYLDTDVTLQQIKNDFIGEVITYHEALVALTGLISDPCQVLETVMGWDNIKCGSPNYQ